MVFDFLQPVDQELVTYARALSSQHLGNKLVFHSSDEFPEINQIQLAIIGVLETNTEAAIDLTPFRRAFYSLFPGNWEAAIADLGDLAPGETVEDTGYALKEIISYLLANKVIPIVLGGSQSMTYYMYRGYDKLEQMVNLVAIDNQFDFGKEQGSVHAGSYLSKIIIDQPTNLFNYCNLGYQTYLNSQEEIDLIEKLYFDAYRLGELINNITLAEPVLRDADLVTIDTCAIRTADSGNFTPFSPNGFDGREICALSRYAGISDKVSAIGVFNQGSSVREALLLAEIVWYFIEGWHYRSNEYPFGSKENYLKYIVPIDDQELVFFKSDKTDRWWIEIPTILGRNNKLQKSSLLPCSYEEYLLACNQEMPERWWKAQRKNNL